MQLIRWGEHPSGQYSRRNAREFSDLRGWTLLHDWEVKINFLEQWVLFDRDPKMIARPWLPGLKRRIRERHYEEQQRRWKLPAERLRQEHEFRESLSKEELAEVDRVQFEQWMFFKRAKKDVLIAHGRCPHCRVEIVPLMLDCLNCGKSLEVN